MNQDLTAAIREAIQLGKKSLGDVDVDVVPIPSHGDRMVRLRTLEEALEDFGNPETEDAISYLIQVKPRKAAPVPPPFNPETSVLSQIQISTDPVPQVAPASARPGTEQIYGGDGKLNLPFLTRNAELLFSAGETTLARNIYKAILQSGERSAMALYWIARCDEAEGKLEDARRNYEESIAYHPSLDTYRHLSTLLMNQKKDQPAAEVLERALNLKDLSQATRLELHKAAGNCWTRARKNDEAEKHFLKALEIEPEADEVRANLGALCLQANRFGDARRHFQDAVAANPRNGNALAGLGSCALGEGDKRLAHDYFARSLDVQINNPTAVYHLVKCAYEIKSYATAARIVEEFIQVAPVNVNLMYSLAGLQFHLGRLGDAGVTVGRILELNPAHAGAAELQGLIQAQAMKA